MSVFTGDVAPHPFTIPLTKIDHEKRLVIGVAAHEIADKSKEIMDYGSAKEQFQKWSEGFSSATGGLSKGNLRVMHTKQVAGRFDDITFDDSKQQVLVCAKVTDDNEWKKVLDGNYTGFSIGGGYLRKWQDPIDPSLTRYTPIVREISLVDNPCIDTARFAELVKADGIVEQLELRGVAHTFGELRKLAAAAEAARPRTFSELRKAAAAAEAARPKTFGELRKEFNEDEHPRGHGGLFAAAGALTGMVAGEKQGRAAGAAKADRRYYHQPHQVADRTTAGSADVHNATSRNPTGVLASKLRLDAAHEHGVQRLKLSRAGGRTGRVVGALAGGLGGLALNSLVSRFMAGSAKSGTA